MENSKLLILSANQAVRIGNESASLVNFDFKSLEDYTWAVTQSGRIITEKDGKYGLVINGIEICPPIYEDVREVADECEWKYGVKLDGKWKYGIVDAIGRKLCEPIYDNICLQNDGVYFVVLDGKIGFLDKVGKDLIKPKYDKLYREWHWKAVALVKLDGKVGLVDIINYKEVVEPKYDSIEMLGDFWEVCVDGKYGLLDSNYEEVCSPKYDTILGGYNGLFEVCLDDKWGAMDETCKEVIVPQYQDIKTCKNGLIAVKDEDEWIFIDVTGKQVSEFKYSSLCYRTEAHVYARRGWRKCKINGNGKEEKMTGSEKIIHF